MYDPKRNKFAPIQDEILDLCSANISCFTSSDRRQRILPLIADVFRHQEEVDIFFQSLQPAFKTLDMMRMAIENEMDAKRYVQPDGLSKLKGVWEQKLLIRCKNLNSEKQHFVLQILECIHQDYSKANRNVFEAEEALAKRVSAKITEFYKQQLQEMPANSDKIEDSIQTLQNAGITAFEKSLNVQTNPSLYQQQFKSLKNTLQNLDAPKTDVKFIPAQTLAPKSKTNNIKKSLAPSKGNESSDTAVRKTEYERETERKNLRKYENWDDTADSIPPPRDPNSLLKPRNKSLNEQSSLNQPKPKDLKNSKENFEQSKPNQPSAEKSLAPKNNTIPFPQAANESDDSKSEQPLLAIQSEQDSKFFEIQSEVGTALAKTEDSERKKKKFSVPFFSKKKNKSPKQPSTTQSDVQKQKKKNVLKSLLCI